MASIEKMPDQHVSDINDQTQASEDDVAPEVIGGTLASLPKGYYTSANFIGTVVAFCLGSMSEYAGYILTFNLLGIINEDIGPNSNYVWIATGYTLAVGVSSLVWGRLSDIFGRRWFFIGGNGLAFIGSVLGATAPNIVTLIFGQVFIGLALPAQLSFSVALAELIPNKWRGYNNGLLFLVAMPFSVFGPVIARNVTEYTSQGWRWAYYINLILAGLTIAFAFFFYHPPVFEQLHTRVSKRKVMRDLDYIGIVLFTAGLVLFLLGVSWGGQLYPWASGHTLGTLLVGVAVLVAFFVWEAKGAKDPLLPPRFLTNLPFAGIVMAAGAGSAVFYPLNVLWPQQISTLWTTDPVQIGWLSCALGGGALLGQIFAGALIGLGKPKLQLIASATAMTGFIAGMAGTNQHNKDTAIALCLLGGFSLGYVENVALSVAPFAHDDKDIGLAIGVLASGRTVIAGIAPSIYMTVLNNKLAQTIPAMVVPAAKQAGIRTDAIPTLLAGFTTGSFAGVPGLTPAILAELTDVYKSAFSKAVQVVYLISIVFEVLAIGGALISRDTGDRFTDDVARRMHRKENVDEKLQGETAV